MPTQSAPVIPSQVSATAVLTQSAPVITSQVALTTVAPQVSATAVPTQSAPVIASQVSATAVPTQSAPVIAWQVALTTVAYQVAPTTFAPSPSVAALPLDRFLELVREQVRADTCERSWHSSPASRDQYLQLQQEGRPLLCQVSIYYLMVAIIIMFFTFLVSGGMHAE